MPGEDLEDPAVAKEPGNGNGQEGSQCIPFPGVPAKKGEIGAKVVDAQRLHPAHDPATDISSDQRGGGEAQGRESFGEELFEIRHGVTRYRPDKASLLKVRISRKSSRSLLYPQNLTEKDRKPLFLSQDQGNIGEHPTVFPRLQEEEASNWKPQSRKT